MLHRSNSRCFEPDVFPATYREGADLWRRGVEALGVVTREFPHPETAADGAPLSCQSAWLGAAAAPGVVVLIAGTHGVEGFTGTAVQVDLFRQLARGELELPAGVALLCINALNPWGYTYSRRCDHEGIDVNRNFIDFSRPPPDNPGYARLREAFRIADPAQRQRALEHQAALLGQRAYEIAFSAGQYSDALGPFFGGTAPSFSRRVIETLMADHALAQRRLAVVDVHTGLGPYGYGEIICDHAPGSGGAATARRWFGPSCTLPAEGTSSSVPKLGLLDYAWHAIMAGNSCFVTLEFGTLGTASLFAVLLDEAACWARGDESGKLHAAARMREHFYPQDQSWREAVVFRSRQVLRQALSGVAP